MKKEVLVTGLHNSCRVPLQSRMWTFGVIFDSFGQFRPLLWPGSHIVIWGSLSSLMKIEWLVTNLTAIRSPAGAERKSFGVIFDIFGQFRLLCIVVGEHIVI